MAARDRIIVGLDIGTTKICCIITELKENGDIEVIGFGISESKGLRRGLVVNMEQTVEAIGCAVEDAERMAGIRVDEVFTGIAGGHIQGITTSAVISVKGEEIAPADKKRVVDQAREFAKPVGVEIIHVLTQEFCVDDISGISDPVGMAGSKLQAHVHIVTGSVSAVSNITKCAQKAGLGLQDIVLQQIASAAAILTPDEMQLGVILMDIGGGTTDIAVFNEGAIRHTAVLALGGDHITNDIAVGIRTPITEAERLKIKYGHAIAARVSTDEQIEVPSIGGDTVNTVPRRILAEIIESRVEELFKLAYTEIRNTGLAETMSAGLVLTGGASSLEGVAQLAESIMHMPVRVGYPRGVKGLVELVNSPAYATAVGLCIYGAGRPSNGYKAKKGSPMYERLLDRLIRWFKEVF
ncbi:MAG: cell division protein FtsA [Desulfomonilia bacterium]|nr:cell division protein FtsA [Deltaproteobacteria bacterium]MDI9541687.1 cell division protein FtsA [Pseudomonadota bacterium]HRR21095.1 cell division protein FtsA [Desulfomonilia bacterium]HRT45084.1 cell division protein FtsA [Desulfomonilia bacterium]